MLIDKGVEEDVGTAPTSAEEADAEAGVAAE